MNIAASLNAKNATQETILQIMNTTVFERSGELSLKDMEAELTREVGRSATAEAMAAARAHPDVVNDVALLWIGALSDDDEAQDLLDGAVADADTQMPMLEVGALTLIALYALYLLGPNKPTRLRTTIKRGDDGSYETVKAADFADFSAPLRGLLGVFKTGRSDQE